jgi:hypothetical protein
MVRWCGGGGGTPAALASSPTIHDPLPTSKSSMLEEERAVYSHGMYTGLYYTVLVLPIHLHS